MNASSPSAARHRSPPPGGRWRRLLVLPVALLSPALLLGGGCLLLAGVSAFQAEAFLADWQAKGNEPEEHAWIVARRGAERAVRLYPVANGHYLHRQGLILQWRQFRQPPGAPAAQETRRAALHAFRAASRAQPTWPAHWSALAQAKLYLLEFDDEFRQALAMARQTGPWRVDSNGKLAEIGLLAWAHLSAAERAHTLEAARRAIGQDPAAAPALLRLAERVEQHRELCGSLAPPPSPCLALP
ncbi:hypothetical protein NGA35_04015 [Pseudomonas stutzeri]|nr:hypothetical protein [Stutzerimonas stutzeri]